jgi:hypothetical protein
MRLLDINNGYSLVNYINEDCISSYKMKVTMERIDEQFFKPWSHYLEEAELTQQQITQIFQSAHKEAQASGANSTMLGKIVEKIVPDSMLQKLSDSLPEPDPSAANDPQFATKAGAAVNKLPVDAETKTGLMKMVANAAKNPAVQPVVLALVGGVLGGMIQKVGPMMNTMGLPGTLVAGVSGALIAGGVALAAAKISGKSWKESFKSAVKPALAGAAGAVVGKLAADFVSGTGSAGADAAAEPSTTTQAQDGMTIANEPVIPGQPLSQNQMMAMKMSMDMGNSYPPEIMAQYNTQAGGEGISRINWDQEAAASQSKSVQQQSREYPGNSLTEGQCYLIMKRVAATNRDLILEGHLVLEAGLAQKAGSWLKTKAQNVTQQVTADKLMTAWKTAGSPMDSNAVADIMQQAGVNPEVVKKVYTGMQLPEPGTEGAADAALTPAETWKYTNPTTGTEYEAGTTKDGQLIINFDGEWETVEDEEDSKAILAAKDGEAAANTPNFDTVKAQVMKLPVDRRVRIVNYMKNQLKVA